MNRSHARHESDLRGGSALRGKLKKRILGFEGSRIQVALPLPWVLIGRKSFSLESLNPGVAEMGGRGILESFSFQSHDR
jgi:hypothetical protein